MTAKRLLAIGWYGAGNVGDELLLSLLVRWAREAGASVVAASIDPTATRALHGIDAVDAWDLTALVRTLRDCDLCVLGGGGLLHTHFNLDLQDLYRRAQGDVAGYVRPLLAARQLGVPVLAWAQGVGPLDGEDARAIVRDVFANAAAAGVRDEGSRALLEDLGVARDLLVAPDPVWTLEIPDVAVVRDRIGIVVRPWGDPSWETKFADALASAIDPARHTLTWIPFQPGAVAGRSESDMALVGRLMQRMPAGVRQDCIADADPPRAVAALAACERVVAMRLHAHILASLRGAPALSIEYDDKVAASAQMTHTPDALRIRPDAHADAWRAALQALVSTQWRMPGDAAAALAERALAHRAQLHTAISAAERRPPETLGNIDWLATWRDEGRQAIDQAQAQAAFWQRAHESESALRAEEGERWKAWLGASQESRKEAESARDAARQDVARMGDALQRMEGEVARMGGEVAGAVHALALARNTLAEREVALADRDETIANLQSAISNLENRIADIEAALLESQGRAARLEYERDATRGQLAERERHLALVLGSRSWRITRPLRALSAMTTREGRQRVLQYFRGVPQPLAAPASTATLAEAHAPPANAPAWLAAAHAAERLAIVPCAFEFDELANQRPINLAKHLAAAGYTVLFAAWQWHREEVLARSGTQVHPGVWQIDLYTLYDHAAELGMRAGGDAVYFITLPAPELVALHAPLRARGFAVVYDILDEWEAFAAVGQAPWFDAQSERNAVLSADAVAAVSPPLAAKFASLRTDMAVIGNGWSPATLGAEHRDCAAAARVPGAPLRIGYFGHLTDAWFDWTLVLDAARAMPDATFEIIGYGEPEWVREAARALPNLVLVGKVQPASLWEHARNWQVALAPFRPGPLAVAIDPIKVYEYLFLGLPTVCTGIPHLAQLPAVEVVHGLDQFVAACRNQASATLDARRIEETLSRTTWAARFDALLALVPRDGGLGALYAV